MDAEVRKWGGSKAIIIPDAEAERLHIGVGDNVHVEIVKKERKSWFGIFKGAKPFVREEGLLDRDIP